jgi:geranylgeranyl reductase family protein
MPDVDVAIVGAGPAGCAAAIAAVRAGLRTVVFDRARFPRDKTCGDGLTAAALRLLEQLGLTAGDLANSGAAVHGGYRRITDVSICSPSGRVVELPLTGRGDHAAVVSRTVLDQALVELARRAGVEVHEGTPVERVAHVDRAVEVVTTASALCARHVIAADGQWSAVRRSLCPGATPRLGEWHAVRQYHEGVDTDRLWVLFERDLLPGYAWVFPLPGGRANVGYGVLRAQGRRGRDLRALWPDLLGRPSLRALLDGARPVEPVRAWPIPTAPRDLAVDRVLFAGDAAGVVDPLTGEGIAQALETGMLAVGAITASGDVAATYRRSVARAIGRDLRFAALLGRVLAHPRGARAALRAVDTNAWTRRQFARWMFEDYPRAALFTPRRWRGIVSPRPGAFADAATGRQT